MYPNWFAHYAVDWFKVGLAELVGKPYVRALQVGAYTGDASVWLLENVLTGNGSTLTDVDTWEGSDEPEHEPFDWADVESFYDKRTSGYGNRIKVKATSADFWRAPPLPADRYDFIYIDGDHTAPGVLLDAVNAVQVLATNGVLAFDDYQWKSGKGRLHDPAVAIDAFADIYADQLEQMATGLQVWFKKR